MMNSFREMGARGHFDGSEDLNEELFVFLVISNLSSAAWTTELRNDAAAIAPARQRREAPGGHTLLSHLPPRGADRVFVQGRV